MSCLFSSSLESNAAASGFRNPISNYRSVVVVADMSMHGSGVASIDAAMASLTTMISIVADRIVAGWLLDWKQAIDNRMRCGDAR